MVAIRGSTRPEGSQEASRVDGRVTPATRPGWRVRRRILVEGLLGAALVAGVVALAPQVAAEGPRGKLAAATESALAAREAIDQMEHGGNAVDAAVAAALVSGVTNPSSSGIGGGGFALAWLAADQRPYVLDFRETAPQAIDVAAFEQRPLAADQRAKLIGVPGEVRGLYDLHHKLGKRPWKDVVLPAARLAAKGYPVGQHLGAVLASEQSRLPPDAGLAAVFYAGGRPAAVGAVVKNPDLARTLERIAAEGPSAFYTGEVAARLVDASRRLGGALTAEDLSQYRSVERKPLTLRWEGYDVYTMPPPSAGGLMLIETLAMMSRDELRRLDPQAAPYQHLVAEAMRGAVADRMRYLGDPAHERGDVGRLVDPRRLARRRASIDYDRTHALPRFGLEEAGTQHLVTADGGGNFVSLTTTVNRVFGAKLTAGDTGVILNDELDDFTAAAAVAPFGMTESPNRPRPGARPVSSMTPTLIARDGRVVLALGGSGGTAIATNVTQVTLGRLVFGTPPEALLAAPRVGIPTESATITLEPGAPPALVAALADSGEIVGVTTAVKSAVQLIAVDAGFKVPAADSRKHGAALAR